MTKKEEKKTYPVEEKHAQITELFQKMEDCIEGKKGEDNLYHIPNLFWGDLHELNNMIKEFLALYFKGCSPMERFAYLRLYQDVALIHLKITMP